MNIGNRYYCDECCELIGENFPEDPIRSWMYLHRCPERMAAIQRVIDETFGRQP